MVTEEEHDKIKSQNNREDAKATVTQRIRLCDCLRLVITVNRDISQGEKSVTRTSNTISCDNDATRYD